MGLTVRDQLEVILSQYAAMRIHQQVAIDQIEQVYAAKPVEGPRTDWMGTYAQYRADGG